MDFQNLPCTCRNPHKWVINLIDHHMKFVNSHPLHAKSADEVLAAVKNYCLSYGYPKKILTDNGGEFCEENQIKLSHGAPRTPTTQGLVERSNRDGKKICGQWLWGQIHNAGFIHYEHHSPQGNKYNTVQSSFQNNGTPWEPPEHWWRYKMSRGNHWASLWYTWTTDRFNTNGKQTSQSGKAPFKIDDMIAIKIDRVDKTSPVHPNMLLGKIMEIRKNYAKLIPCTSRNVTVDHCKEISFTAACKQANNTRL